MQATGRHSKVYSHWFLTLRTSVFRVLPWSEHRQSTIGGTGLGNTPPEYRGMWYTTGKLILRHGDCEKIRAIELMHRAFERICEKCKASYSYVNPLETIPTPLLHPSYSNPSFVRLWSSDDSIPTILPRRRTHRRRVVIHTLSALVGALRLLQFHTLLLTTEIALILFVALIMVPLVRNRRRVHRRCLVVVVGIIRLRWSAGVLSWSVARWCRTCRPTRTTVGRATKAATSACCDTTEQVSVRMVFGDSI